MKLMEGAQIKNRGILGIVLGICMILTSCTLQTNDDSKLINSVKQIETYDYKLNTFQITYDNYKKNTQKLMASYFNKDNEVLLVYNSKVYKGKDLVGMSLNKYEELGEKLLNEHYGTTEIKSGTVNISNVYYSKDDPSQFKYVFAKCILEIGDEKNTIYKRYSFLQLENEWKISSIDQITETKDFQLDKNQLSGYTTYNNSPIKYAHSINLLENQ